jgi:flagellar motility protein MotE (MotC chaperone)
VTDEQVQQPQAEQPQEAAPVKKGGMMSYIMLGGGFVVVMAVAIAATLFLMGGGDKAASNGDTHGETAHTEQVAKMPAGDASHASDSTDVPVAENPAILDEIEANLAMLDYQPTEAEIAEEEAAVSVEDSIKKANWFAKEQDRLDKREDSLNAREKKLVALDREVSKKVTKIEQAESERIVNLARLYDGMDPRAVAKLMANLDDATIVSILPRMKNRNASQVLAMFPAQRAARLSKQMITIAGDGQ